MSLERSHKPCAAAGIEAYLASPATALCSMRSTPVSRQSPRDSNERQYDGSHHMAQRPPRPRRKRDHPPHAAWSARASSGALASCLQQARRVRAGRRRRQAPRTELADCVGTRHHV